MQCCSEDHTLRTSGETKAHGGDFPGSDTQANSAQDSPPRAVLCTNLGKVYVDAYFVFLVYGCWAYRFESIIILNL